MTTTAPDATVDAVPTGTVTFFFSDIEGSTRIAQELGVATWAPLLERHRAIVREALAAGGGHEILTEGDSFFAVFTTAPAAVTTAAAVQRRLAAEDWPQNAPIRVRIGLHTGQGILDADGSFVGADVHRAARIGAAAHGGQVLISEATRGLLGETLPAEVSLIDLGRHRLKDLSAERLSQLCIAGLHNEFPTLKSVDLNPNNLPTQLTSFVGRDEELAEAAKLLQASRHLTLTGPGGTGKTRLSLQLAAAHISDFEDGVWFVPLETIRDPDLVPPTIAKTLGVGLSVGRSAAQMVADWIGGKQLLLLLDNFEQVIEAANVVSDLMRACPNLKVICTSRIVLRVAGEQEYEVPGLPAPPDLSRMSLLEIENLPESERHPDAEALSQYEAVRLFIARAAAVKRGFAVTNENAPALAQICAHLHGMPLAIELAAARVKLLSLQQILARLEDKFALLTTGSRDLPARQQTLRGAIEWSYELLDPAQQILAARLAVFNGGWDLDAAEVVAGSDGAVGDVLDGLASLVDQSLVRQEDVDGEVRFELFPTIRQFLESTLTEQGEIEATSGRHAGFFMKLAEEAAPNLHGDEQRQWMDRLEREHDNMRAAIDWTTAEPDPETAVRLVFALWRFWQQRGYVREARHRLESVLDRQWEIEASQKARLLEAAGGIAYWQADLEAASAWYGEALEIWRKDGNKKEIANAIYNRAFTDLIPVIKGAGSLRADEANLAVEACNEALEIYRELGDRPGEGNILWALGGFSLFSARFHEALEKYQAARAIFEEVGNRTMEAWSVYMAMPPQIEMGDVVSAVRSTTAALALFNSAGDLSGVAMSLHNLSALAVIQGDMDRAGRLHGSSEKLLASTGAELAGQFEGALAAHAPAHHLSASDLDRLGKEGAAMALDEVIAYALETG